MAVLSTIEPETLPSTSKRPTLQDVAGVLGMHKSTVSLALSGKGSIAAHTRTRVISVAQELGYEPDPLAQRLAKGYQNPAICILSGVLDVGIGTQKLLMIQKELSSKAFDVPIYTCPESTGDGGKSQVSQIRQIVRHRPRAIICASQRIDASSLGELEAYQRTGGIVVSYDIPIPLDCDQVIFDREDNGYQAAKYLLDHGHRKVGINISQAHNKISEYPYGPNAIRLQGYMRALQYYGVATKSEWFLQNSYYERGGVELAQSFLQLADRPTALCIVNDYVALAFMAELIRIGVRIPQDVSLVGHDDQTIASYCPVALTSVSQPIEEIANMVILLLQERLNGSREPLQKIVVKGEVIERDSVVDVPISNRNTSPILRGEMK